MKLFLIIVCIGIAEILAISFLHQKIGLLNSIGVYVIGTAIGGSLLFFGREKLGSQFQKVSSVNKSWYKRIKKKPKTFTEKDAENIRILNAPMLFILAVIFVCVPGIVTDVVGILLAIPAIRNSLIELQIKSYTRKSKA